MLTVLFATYNGRKTLPGVLSEYRKLDMPERGWKLVIVDNGSNDGTREIVNDFQSLLPVTLLVEPKRGKNVALNTGLSHTEGDLIVFTDDDVIPNASWLRELRSAADSHPEYSIFGGPVLPEWECPPEDWIVSWVPLKPVFAVLDDVQAEGPIENYMVFGPNMAVRSDVFLKGYRFDETIGPRGTNYAQGSETRLLMELDRAGFKAWHCKKAIVRHIIRSHQMKKKWVLARAIRFGRGQYRLGFEYSGCKATLWGLPKGLPLHIMRTIYHLAKVTFNGDEEKIFKGRWRLNYLLGVGLEARLIHRERKNSISLMSA